MALYEQISIKWPLIRVDSLKKAWHCSLLFTFCYSLSIAILSFAHGTNILTFLLRFPLILTTLRFTSINFWYEPSLWNLDMNLHYKPLSFEPLNPSCNYDGSYYVFCICITSHGGSMFVSLMHQWYDSRVVEWCSIPSLSIIYVMATMIMICLQGRMDAS